MSTPPARRDVIVIGASAGGLPHIRTLLELLPADLPAIVLVVLHRPGGQVSHLREVLAAKSRMQVVEAVHGEELLVGVCYLGQPAKHLGIDELIRAKLSPDPGGARRGKMIDDLFVSVARHAGPRVIGVVLSGALRDGTQGLAAIKRAGGIALVQSPAEAQFAGMPESAIAYDHIVDLVASTAELAQAIERYVRGETVEARPQGAGR
jgi:two-component system chemotaxis response regulator CheB